MTRQEDVKNKIEKVREYMKKNGADGAVIRKKENFSWITDGAKVDFLSYVLGDPPIIFLTFQEAYVIAKDEDVSVLEGELTDDFTVISYPWFSSTQKTVSKISDGQNILYEDDVNFDSFLFHSRISMTEYETDEYILTSKRTLDVLEKVMKELSIGITGREVQIELYSQFISKGLNPIRISVLSHERGKSGEPRLTPVKKLSKTCTVLVSVEEKGLMISVARSVELSRDMEFEEVYKSAQTIFAQMVHSSYRRDLMSLFFMDLENSYERNFHPYEWQNHDQGGITGRKIIEVLARPHFPFPLKERMVFSWKTTLPGVVLEDMYIKGANRMYPLTLKSEGWSHTVFEFDGYTYEIPDVLKI